MTTPIKVLKFCPKCGSSNFTAQSHKSFICQKCKFNFFVNSAAAVAAIIVNEKDEVLLTVRAHAPNKGMLDLPGGFVDPNESLNDALIRELKEELNLTPTSMLYLDSYPNQYIFSDYTVYTTDVGFVCTVKGWDKLHIQDDVCDVQFVTKENVDWNKIAYNSIKNILKKYWSIK